MLDGESCLLHVNLCEYEAGSRWEKNMHVHSTFPRTKKKGLKNRLVSQAVAVNNLILSFFDEEWRTHSLQHNHLFVYLTGFLCVAAHHITL